jgi:tRNA pseudouridine38-40 synthase
VHARGQVAHFDAATRIPIERLAKAINSRLPDDIDVLHAEPVPEEFDAIGSTKSKQYRYRLYHSERRPLSLRNYVYHCWTPLDVARMNDAARRLIGTHDFSGFTTLHHDRKTTVRTIYDCHVEQPPELAPEVHIVVSASGFLYNMVRIIAGTLLEVGRGRFAPEYVDAILKEGRDPRKPAGPTLPATGLWLEWIRYD